VKPSGWAILILSALLAAAVGWIWYSTVRSDQALKDAKTELEEANAKTADALAQNVILTESNTTLSAENASQAATILRNGRTIATLEGKIKAAHDISVVAVGQGADLKTSYDAGRTIVDQAGIPALSIWYDGNIPRIDSVLISLGLMQIAIAQMTPELDKLRIDNADLLAGNIRQQITIDGQRYTISEQVTTLEGLRGDLSDAGKDVTAAMNRERISDLLAWIFGAAAVVGAGYIIIDQVRQ
jgi:predicted heme/steroid binding protein